MFEVVVSDRFALWYEALPEREAEEVTLALDVAARLGAAVDPERGRELLLWYDGAHSVEALSGGIMTAQIQARGERFSRLVWWGRRVSQCLESAAFSERLAALDGPRAQEALLAVERVKNLLAGARLVNLFGALEQAPRVPLSAAERWLLQLLELERDRLPLRGGEACVERHPLASGGGPGSVQLAALEALRAVGLSARAVFAAPSGLREITIEVDGQRSRLIVGVDVERQRLIAILGEPLDRAYYGDSVKFAEGFFRDYLRREEGESATL